jgi:hypothetical protein
MAMQVVLADNGGELLDTVELWNRNSALELWIMLLAQDWYVTACSGRLFLWWHAFFCIDTLN